MAIKIESEWVCPQCDAPLDKEECSQVREMLPTRGQVDLRCEDCGEELTADTSSCSEGEVNLNEQWVYD
jgi:predicted amidophosphoribosyltransferase